MKHTPVKLITLLAAVTALLPASAASAMSFVLCMVATLLAAILCVLERYKPGSYAEPYPVLILVNITLLPAWLPGLLCQIGLAGGWLPAEFSSAPSIFQGPIQ